MINETLRKDINVDKSNILPIFSFKEGDNAILKLALFKNSVEFDITGQTVRLGAKTKSGLIEQIDGFTISKNNLDIILKNSILAPGKIEIDLEMKDSNGIMTTASFFITVNQKVLNDEAVKATNEFDSFTQAMNIAENALKKTETHINNLDSHITASERTKWNNKLDKSSIIMSTLEPSDSDGKDGDMWIMYEVVNPLLSISVNGTTAYPLTHKAYTGKYDPYSELINHLDGSLSFTGATLTSYFTVEVESDDYVYRYLDYWTGTLNGTDYTGEALEYGIPTGLLEVMNRVTSKIYYYKIVGTT